MLMIQVYEWLNREKQRFYKITVQRKGIADIVLNYHWGSCNSNRGGNKNLYVREESEAENYIRQMMKRRKSRGYDLITP